MSDDVSNSEPERRASSPGYAFESIRTSQRARHRPGYTRISSISSGTTLAQQSTHNTDSIEADLASRGDDHTSGLGITTMMMDSSDIKKNELFSVIAIDENAEHRQVHAAESSTTLNDQAQSNNYLPLRDEENAPSFSEQSIPRPRDDMDAATIRSGNALLPGHPGSRAFLPGGPGRGLGNLRQGRLNGLPLTIISLAIFATVMSLAFLIIAIASPHYGRSIRTNGGALTPATAAFFTSLLAKLIELASAMVVVAFIGQALARRALLGTEVHGVTLAELGMRYWVMQPGSVLMQWEGVRYAGPTLLGVIALLAAILTILYTSAATALVQPQLAFPPWKNVYLSSVVKTIFANPEYITATCKTPIQMSFDPINYAQTCLGIELASETYHNFFQYLATWAQVVGNGSGSPDLALRPPGFALLSDNTTITAPWIERHNVTVFNETRFINNVTMAMPHTGVTKAAVDPANNLLQLDDVEGAILNIRASLPSPFVNVLCMTLTGNDLVPFVYGLWSNASGQIKPYNVATWPKYLSYDNNYLNGTAFDDIFGWGEAYGASRYPPVFPILPAQFNTIINGTGGLYGRPTTYFLARGGPTDIIGDAIPQDPLLATNYALCQMQVGLTPACSTRYDASSSGGTLEAICEDDSDPLQYSKSDSTARAGNASINLDWPNVAQAWGSAVSINDGVFDGNGSLARLLSQFILTSTNLSAVLPSTAEALAVMAGSTLILSMTDGQLFPFWNYSTSYIDGARQYFNSSLREQQYSSGGTQTYQKAFFPVLIAAFVMNASILLYFLLHRRWYKDFSEPMTLFGVAMNSPPTPKPPTAPSPYTGGGSWGDYAAPSPAQSYRHSWKIRNEGDFMFMESQVEGDLDAGTRPRRRTAWSSGWRNSRASRALPDFEMLNRTGSVRGVRTST